MFITTHLIVGLIIGALTGNYYAAILGSLIMDLDHFVSYFRHKVKIVDWPSLWMDPEDPLGDQRNFMHNIWAWMITSVILVMINMNFGFVFSVAYLAHLILDMMNASISYLFYPLKWEFEGAIRYLSRTELLLSLILLLAMLFVI